MRADVMEPATLAPFGIAIVRLDGTISYADDFYAMTMGVPSSELIGRNIADFADVESGYSPMTVMGLLLKTKQPMLSIRHYVREDGAKVPCQVQLCILRDDRGEPHSIYSVLQVL